MVISPLNRNFASMKLSIVIPVYNVVETLQRCAQSILSQEFGDYQVILVDDGSTDGSALVCDELAHRDARIQALHIPNGGLSVARNSGLEHATGDYVTFVDSDDFIAENSLNPLMNLLAAHPEYDILEYSLYQYKQNAKDKAIQLDDRVFTDMREYWYDQKTYNHTYACNKIFRMELFNKLQFEPGKAFEDMYLLPAMLEKCRCVATTSRGYYCYCYNPKGITATAGEKELTDLFNAHLDVMLNMAFLRPFTADYYLRVLNIALDLYEATGRVPKELPMPEMLMGREPLKIKALKLLGLKKICVINQLIHKIIKR